MSDTLEYIRNAYKVPANVGQRITFHGKPGTIVGGRGAHLLVHLDGESVNSILHPTWEVEYLDQEAE